jgi:putative redox protein
MDIRITFPSGKRVEAELGGHRIQTDQSVAHGGEGSAPEPFDLFLASLATCAGAYVLGFCQARQIPTASIGLVQRARFEDDGHLSQVEIELDLPKDFPEKYRAAVVRSAASCKVKKALATPPDVRITVREVGLDAAQGTSG